MKVLVLSFYFEPDLSAGAFRNTAFVHALAKKMGSNDRIDVVTTSPNRYRTFVPEPTESGDSITVKVRRIKVPTHNSGMLDQARAFITYAREVLRTVKSERYDLVYASSSRLMTAVLGARVANAQRVPLYLDIRDIFTRTMSDMLRGSVFRILVPGLSVLESYAIRTAYRVNLAIPEFLDHFTSIDKRSKYSSYTNGVDNLIISTDFSCARHEGPLRILYAGNIGEGQGLHRIIPEAARLLGEKYEFLVIGDGGKRSLLAEAVLGLTNVVIKNPVAREELMSYYRSADILFMHLNDYPVFLNAIPSKLFEYGGTGKPILAGVAGKTATFVREELTNAAVFSPCDATALKQAVGRLHLVTQRRANFVARYRRDKLMDALAADVMSIVDRP